MPTGSPTSSPPGSSSGPLWDAADVGGVGGTLAGNALQLAAVRATLGEVLTADAYERMIALAERYEEGVNGAIDPTGSAGAPSGSAAGSSTCSRPSRRMTGARRPR